MGELRTCRGALCSDHSDASVSHKALKARVPFLERGRGGAREETLPGNLTWGLSPPCLSWAQAAPFVCYS